MRRQAWPSKAEEKAEELIGVLEPLLERIEEDEFVSPSITALAATVEVKLVEFRRELNAVQAARD